MPFTKESAKKYAPMGTPARVKKKEQWEKFALWFMGNGMEKMEQEMGTLEGKEYVQAMKDMLEYFKPKLARTELTGKDGKDLPIPILGIEKEKKKD